ncbi:phosphate transport system permease protein pstA [Vibrio ishigakensis]|uniref:Phosphate transport system permease protein PstA n=1 Tax=Vibrio ishigakensis TaxID=1481914 RepID=A0A0B8NJJ3_9VIBR|nr:phosphate transport system permease protein pstA [Vibrio ishigakensis]
MAVTTSILLVLGILLFIGWNGLNHFWTQPVYQWQNQQGRTLVGEIFQRQQIDWEQLSAEQQSQVPMELRSELESQRVPTIERLIIKVANRDVYGHDFISTYTYLWPEPEQPEDILVLDRVKSGQFIGRAIALTQEGQRHTDDLPDRIKQAVDDANEIRAEINSIVNDKVEPLSWQLQSNREQITALIQSGEQQGRLKILTDRRQQLNDSRNEAEARVEQLQEILSRQSVWMRDMHGHSHLIKMNQILDAWYPNAMSTGDKLKHWFSSLWNFIVDDPRESNSEGGVFPAIFGTVLLVLLMSVAVMPLGVLAGVYLHEYAQNNWLTRLVRITVNNLAGVPSIVYGVFGLGFFVYSVGGTIDELFYSDALPAPTFGTPGLLWASLTLAMLTLPVVIVTIEDGLSRIPQSVRHGSFALGATKSETLLRVVLPMAMPAVLTALILAVARAAGEVAPLMLVGVVKLAPSLPIDGQFPYIHLERKFMHLGFHIYDVGFQTSNLEAAKSLVYATSMLLVTVIIGLNLIAIRIRNSLRESFRNLGFDEHVF